MKTLITPLIAVIALALSACNSQRTVVAETDDIYYTGRDRAAAQTTNVTVIQPEQAPEFSEGASDDGYFVKGSAKQQGDTSQEYYSEDEAARYSSTTSDDGTTINNFYGTTNYYESDYNSSYATRIRRFSSTNVAVGYGYYDPFFIDPYWNYGWSAWNPYYNPWRPRWSVGWNSWYGWNVGYGFGYSPGWAGWYGNYWGAGLYGPYGGPGWGGGYWGNSYWNGYNNGYWNGYNDGLWYGDGGSNSRGIYTGRRGLANETGFVSNGRGNNSPNQDIADKVGDRPVGIVDREIRNSNDKKGNMTASAERLNNASSIYKVEAGQLGRAGVKKPANVPSSNEPKKATASSLKQRTPAQPVNSRIKYESSELARTNEVDKRYGQPTKGSSYRQQAPIQKERAVSPGNSGQPARIQSEQSKQVRQTPNVNGGNDRVTPNVRKDNYYRSPEREAIQRKPSNDRNDRYVPSPQRSNSPSYDRYERKPAQRPAKQRYNQPSSPDRSRSVSPSRPESPSRRSYDRPSRNSSPNRSYNKPSSPSRGSFSSPSRSSSPSRGSFSSPSRSSSPSRGSFSSPSRSGGSSSSRSGGRPR